MRIALPAPCVTVSSVSLAPIVASTTIVALVSAATSATVCRRHVKAPQIVLLHGNATQTVVRHRWCVSPIATVRCLKWSVKTMSVRHPTDVSPTPIVRLVCSVSQGHVFRCLRQTAPPTPIVVRVSNVSLASACLKSVVVSMLNVVPVSAA